MTEVLLKGLTLCYEGQSVPALDRADLDIEDGKLTALLGPSGCGKTTTMKLIAGLLKPTAGDILFDGTSVLPVSAEKRKTAMVFQKHLLFPYMSVGENVAFGLKMRGIAADLRRPRVAELLDLVKLPGMEDRKPSQLSGGQQQRVALARALIIQPDVLLLDEPLSALDAHLRDEMRELIHGIQRRLGITTVLVTHDQEEAVVLADRIAVMFDGRICQYDEPPVFYDRPQSIQIARFFGTRNLIPARIAEGVAETAIGRFAVQRGLVQNGPGMLTIRPEAMVIGKEDANGLSARITARVYLGTQVRVRFDIDGQELEGLFPPDVMPELEEGRTVGITLPAKALWVMPHEA
ncbi:MAG: ABC transporter ATP-binding protein [Rhodospirillales bacterium]